MTARQPKNHQALMDSNFHMIQASAIVGARASLSKPYGPLDPAATSALARAGRIKVEIFAKNWRVITIMEGEHRGKHTQRPPTGGKPYKLVYLDHVIPRRASV